MASGLEVVVFIVRDLDIKQTFWLETGKTVWNLKEQLAQEVLTGEAAPSSICLRLAGAVLRDDEPVSRRLAEVDLCPATDQDVRHAAEEARPGQEAEVGACPPADQDARPATSEAGPKMRAEVGISLPAGQDSWPATEKAGSKKAARAPAVRPQVDVCITWCGFFEGLELYVPDGCTIERWKDILTSGELLGQKVLHVGKLKWHAVSSDGKDAGPALNDKAPLPLQPGSVAVSGNDTIIKMLELALRKKLGPPNSTRSRPQAVEPSRSASQQLPLKLTGKDKHLDFFSLGLQGKRPGMEDRSSAVLKLPGYERAAFFGVYDGHGGDKVADLVAKHLPDMLAQELKEKADPIEAFESAFSIADNKLGEAMRKESSTALDLVGSTAITLAIFREDGVPARYICGNCGDSRAVLCRGGKALDLSRDHKPEEELERERILAAGGTITLQGRISVQGAEGLNLSRAFGDFAYKARRDLDSRSQTVTAHPELWGDELKPDDEFVALGSDGVFDVFSSAELVARLRASLLLGESLDGAVRGTLEEAKQSNDNVTLCLVLLPGGRPLLQ